MPEIQNNNQYAVITADLMTCRERLRNNRDWGAETFRLAGEYGWRVKMAKRSSRGPFRSRIIEVGDKSFIAWGITGKKSFLAYQIEPETESTIRIIPLVYLEKQRKTAIAITLAVFFIAPVLLAPLVWWWYEAQIIRASRIYLPAFCRYLES